jgi:hypothetical protein
MPDIDPARPNEDPLVSAEESEDSGGRLDEVTDEEVERYTEEARDQLARFAASPARVEAFFDFLDRTLRDGVSGPDLFDRIRESGSFLIGDEGVNVIFWAAATDRFSGPEETFDLPEEVDEVLRRLLGIYGPELKRVVHLSDSPNSRGNDWEALDREVRFDSTTHAWLLRYGFVKFNGERFFIECGLPSAARLTTRLVRSILSVDDLGALEGSDRDVLLSEFSALKTRLDEAVEDPRHS